MTDLRYYTFTHIGYNDDLKMERFTLLFAAYLCTRADYLGTFGKNMFLLIATMVFFEKKTSIQIDSNRNGYHYCIWNRALKEEKGHLRKNRKKTTILIVAMMEKKKNTVQIDQHGMSSPPRAY